MWTGDVDIWTTVLRGSSQTTWWVVQWAQCSSARGEAEREARGPPAGSDSAQRLDGGAESAREPCRLAGDGQAGNPDGYRVRDEPLESWSPVEPLTGTKLHSSSITGKLLPGAKHDSNADGAGGADWFVDPTVPRVPWRTQADVGDYEAVATACSGVPCVLRTASCGMPAREQSGQAHSINDREQVNVFQWLQPLFEKLGHSMPRTCVPVHLVYAAALTMEWVHLLLRPLVDLPPLLTRSKVRNVGVTHTFCISKARHQLGYRPREFCLSETLHVPKITRIKTWRTGVARHEALMWTGVLLCFCLLVLHSVVVLLMMF
ncbi:uncharacterized protein LOC144726540 [Lampetra planeri]